MISTVWCSKFTRLLRTIFDFNAEHIHTDGTQYEYVWALAFYEKRHLYSAKFMEWYFTFEEGVHET